MTAPPFHISLPVLLISVIHMVILLINVGSTDSGKSLQARQHNIVLAAGAVDDEWIAALVRADEHAYMTIAGVKHQIAGERFAP